MYKKTSNMDAVSNMEKFIKEIDFEIKDQIEINSINPINNTLKCHQQTWSSRRKDNGDRGKG